MNVLLKFQLLAVAALCSLLSEVSGHKFRGSHHHHHHRHRHHHHALEASEEADSDIDAEQSSAEQKRHIRGWGDDYGDFDQDMEYESEDSSHDAASAAVIQDAVAPADDTAVKATQVATQPPQHQSSASAATGTAAANPSVMASAATVIAAANPSAGVPCAAPQSADAAGTAPTQLSAGAVDATAAASSKSPTHAHQVHDNHQAASSKPASAAQSTKAADLTPPLAVANHVRPTNFHSIEHTAQAKQVDATGSTAVKTQTAAAATHQKSAPAFKTQMHVKQSFGADTDNVKIEDADEAMTAAVSKAQTETAKVLDEAIGSHSTTEDAETKDTGDDIQHEAKDIESEEAQIMEESAGNELADVEDEKFESSVASESKSKATAEQQQAQDEDGDVQLAAEETHGGDEDDQDSSYAQDVNGEAKEIEDEDSQIEKESMEDERAGAELDEIGPDEAESDEAEPAVSAPPKAEENNGKAADDLAASLTASPGNAVSFHAAPHHIKNLRSTGISSDVLETSMRGNAMDAMRNALAATEAATRTLPSGVVSGSAQNISIDAANSASTTASAAGSDKTIKHALIQRRHKKSFDADDDSSTSAEASDIIQGDTDGEVEEIQAEGNRGDKDLDPVEKEIVAHDDDDYQSGAEQDETHGQGDEGIDSVEAGADYDDDSAGIVLAER